MKVLSQFANKFTQTSAIAELMQDLGEASHIHDERLCMLGGGNPAIIPNAAAVFQREAQALMEDGTFIKGISSYSSPQGDHAFIQALAHFLRQRYGWDISEKNIALSNGSQNSFFYLFNILAGQMTDGSHKKILFPLSPEYVGYMDLGLSVGMFASNKPSIEHINERLFKYRINFDELAIGDDIAAICVSRPTNPTGNVITDYELEQLDALAKQYDIPLIIDNAYGLPFPGAIYTDAKLTWNDNIILGMSLSKLGLPGLRTGIVIASEEMIAIMSRINGTSCLAPSTFGASLLTRLIKTEEIITLRDTHIRPFYEQKMQRALELVNHTFQAFPQVRVHKPEGAFFLWLWFEDLPITSKVLYQRLKEKLVYVIPAEDFFTDIDPEWSHQYQCIRINYAASDEQLQRGLHCIAQELEQLYITSNNKPATTEGTRSSATVGE